MSDDLPAARMTAESLPLHMSTRWTVPVDVRDVAQFARLLRLVIDGDSDGAAALLLTDLPADQLSALAVAGAHLATLARTEARRRTS